MKRTLLAALAVLALGGAAHAQTYDDPMENYYRERELILQEHEQAMEQEFQAEQRSDQIRRSRLFTGQPPAAMRR